MQFNVHIMQANGRIQAYLVTAPSLETAHSLAVLRFGIIGPVVGLSLWDGK